MTVAGAGVGLGLLAFVGDFLAGLPGQFFRTLVSTGSAWGGAAFVAGYAALRPRKAAAEATLLLVVATFAYYGLILLGDPGRWHGGILADGSSAATYGLLSMARATGFWLVASVAGGLVLGYLGNLVRTGSRRIASVAAGSALGLLSGEGVAIIILVRPWAGLDDGYVGTRAILAASTVALLLIVTTLMLRYRGSARSWSLFAVSAGAVTALGAAVWGLVEAIRTSSL